MAEAMSVNRSARPSTGWARIHWTRAPARTLVTNLDPVDELFAILRYVAEVADEGARLIKTNTPGISEEDSRKRHSKARAFVRQAENFYRAGERTPYRTSALLYYYAFMNLAKALLEIRGVEYDRRHHGLTREDPASDDLHLLAIDVRPRGIFPSFYNCEFGVDWPLALRPTIGRLLAYVTEIGYQYSRSGVGPETRFIAPCKLRAVVNTATKECWLELAVRRDMNLLSNGFKRFNADFAEVELPHHAARDRYNIYAEAFFAYRFFESDTRPFPGTIPVDQLCEMLYAALNNHIDPTYIGSELDVMLTCSYDDGDASACVNELIAIYLGMFYLGSLVRYSPDYLDHLLGTKSAYVLESFVTSAPHSALRAFTSRINGEIVLLDR
jgi:hypothetical protein